MNMPGFNAESSLSPTIGVYQKKAVFGRSGKVEVLPMQGFLSSSTLSQNLVSPDALFPIIRCCQYSQSLRRFVCVSRVQRPLERCECKPTPSGFPPNLPTVPSIVCRDPVVSQF